MMLGEIKMTHQVHTYVNVFLLISVQCCNCHVCIWFTARCDFLLANKIYNSEHAHREWHTTTDHDTSIPSGPESLFSINVSHHISQSHLKIALLLAGNLTWDVAWRGALANKILLAWPWIEQTLNKLWFQSPLLQMLQEEKLYMLGKYKISWISFNRCLM